MSDREHRHIPGREMEEQIRLKEERKLRARSHNHHSIWFGLGMFGVVGWSVATPTLLGIAMGCWLDRMFPSRISWCLTFLFLGVVAGLSIAWNWIKKEGGPDK
ncbi:MAG: AtpZ/AtpI family protein [Planctomycetaceae bacterium]|nr:AtpZ/AtpI family protein [Planctomycetaceae bacterium]